MKVCIECGAEYEPIAKGGILIHVCEDCRSKAPEDMPKSPWEVRPSGIYMPAPAKAKE